MDDKLDFTFHKETDRLILREMRVEDAPDFFALNADWEVLKYTGDDPFENIHQAEEFLRNYPSISYLKDGFGRWTCILKETSEIIGWCGLRVQNTGETDLGYRFHRRFWGKGYATESSIASLNTGFYDLELDTIIARAAKENKASIHVIEKLGMKLRTEEVFHGLDGLLYELSKQNWDIENREGF